MAESETDMRAIAEAFELFTKTTQSMEEAYRRLEARIHVLDTELADKNRELALANESLNAILESMSDGVVAVDMQDNVITFNLAASRILGYDARDVIGKPFKEVFNRDFSVYPGQGTHHMRTRSNREITVSERDSIVADQANRRLGKVKVFQDLSEILALREQVRQKDRLAAIGEMAATVAHEIRNPLGGIRGFASLLAQDIPESDPRSRLVTKILAGVKSLDRVITELLEYTRPVELHLRPVACTEIVAAALSFIDMPNQAITVVTSVEEGVRVLADGDKMRQVFLNILLNAYQSMEDAGTITISSEVNEKMVTVHIQDTGCGIPEDQLETIFSPFFTTKEKGSGLGLAVVQKIVMGHGGEIQVQSTPGVGTRFSIQLARAE